MDSFVPKMITNQTKWLIDWYVNWLAAWLIDWLIDWLDGYFTPQTISTIMWQSYKGIEYPEKTRKSKSKYLVNFHKNAKLGVPPSY